MWPAESRRVLHHAGISGAVCVAGTQGPVGMWWEGSRRMGADLVKLDTRGPDAGLDLEGNGQH